MNKMTIIGNLTKDPELRVTQSGTSVCSFTVAVNLRKSGDDITQYFRVTAWRQLAEICGKFLRKGTKVFVCGTLTLNEYNKDGEKRYSLDIEAQDMEILSSRASDSSASRESDSSVSRTSQTPPPHQMGYTEVQDNDAGFTAVETDELPF